MAMSKAPEGRETAGRAWTPGPWSVVLRPIRKSSSVNGARVVSVDGTHVANVPNRADKPIFQKEADLHLIAASPELFEALETFVEEYCALVNSGDAGNWDPEEEPKVIAARAALSRATATGEVK